MGAKTKIDWCDSTWNPVTGCFHGCAYCYARGITRRYAGYNFEVVPDSIKDKYETEKGVVVELEHQLMREVPDKSRYIPAVYPFDFNPTFHRYKLHEIKKWKSPKTIFVCSMADLFGEWVPYSWIRDVFNACKAAPQHRYMFLTKNPARYVGLESLGLLPHEDNFWFGTTCTKKSDPYFFCEGVNTFCSIEPIHEPFTDMTDEGQEPVCKVDWIIVGAETGRRKDRIVPEKSWITELVDCANKTRKPIFMKESLCDIMGEDFIQQFPWEV